MKLPAAGCFFGSSPVGGLGWGVPAALGYANAAKIPFELGIIRNHYVGRTFIEPTDSIRHLGVRLKHNPNRAKLKGKRVVLVDDSIVRGTTSRKLVRMVRSAGAREVHLRISCPPTVSPCFYGVDTPTKSELIAANHSRNQHHHIRAAVTDEGEILAIDDDPERYDGRMPYRRCGRSGRCTRAPLPFSRASLPTP